MNAARALATASLYVLIWFMIAVSELGLRYGSKPIPHRYDYLLGYALGLAATLFFAACVLAIRAQVCRHRR